MTQLPTSSPETGGTESRKTQQGTAAPQHSTTFMRQNLARGIGIITHPVAIGAPVAIVSGVHELGWPSLPLMIMGVTTFFASIGLPVAVIWLLYQKGIIGKDVHLFRRENRFFVYPFVLVGFLLDIALFTWVVPLRVGLAMSWAGLIAVSTLFVINFATKVSIHNANLAAIFMGALTIYGKEALLFLPLLPAVIWARVTARNHTFMQAVLGMVVGASIVWLVMFFAFPDINKMTWQNVQSYGHNPPAYWLPFSGRPK